MTSDSARLIDEITGLETPAEVAAWKAAHDLNPEIIRESIRRVAHLLDSDIAAALRLAGAATLLAESLGNRFSLAQALRANAAALSRSSENQRALDCFNQALEIFEAEGNPIEAAKTMMNRVNAYLLLSRFDEALADADRVSAIYEQAGEHAGLAKNLINVAHIHFRLNRFAEGLLHLEKAEQILVRINDYRTLCYIYRDRAVALTSLNRPEEAFRFYGLAIDLAAVHDMPAQAAECEYNISYLYYLQGNYRIALKKLAEVQERMKQQNNRWHSALCDLDRSEIYLELNMVQESIDLANAASKAFEALGMRYEMGKSVALAGVANGRLRRNDIAHELFDRAESVFNRDGNECWRSLIMLYRSVIQFNSGHFETAQTAAQAAHESFCRSGLKSKATYALLLSGRANLELGKLDAAAEDAAQSFRLWHESPVPWLEYQVHQLNGDICRRRKNRPDAILAYRTAMDSLERLRTNVCTDELRLAFLKDKLKVFDSMISVLLAQCDSAAVQESFQIVERAKSRALADLLASDPPQSSPESGTDSGLEQRLRQLRMELNWHYKRMDIEEAKGPAAQAAVQELRKEVFRREREMTELVRESQQRASHFVREEPPADLLESLHEAIPAGSALLEYYLLDDDVLVYVVSPKTLQLFRLQGASRTVKRTFELLRFQLEGGRRADDKNIPAVQAHLQRLYNELIQPVEAAIQDRSSLIFVPHGFLHYLPFHALFDGQDYLVDRFNISYAPSSTIFKLCGSRPQREPGPPLLMGVPDRRAPMIADEIREIEAIFPNAQIFLGENATDAALKEFGGNAGIIHLASHASYRQDNPLFSYIHLGNARLSLHDIYDFRTSADLVALSGCGTGMNSVVGGDELVGLVRGFLFAGASSVMVSLWDVHDQSTALWMRIFYENLAAGRTKSESLRQAMTGLKQKFPHPYYWAPFILVGDPGKKSGGPTFSDSARHLRGREVQ